jgi:hypothetical protein
LRTYLLDTSVLSLLVPGRPDATPELLQWVAERDTTLHLSTVSISEVSQGIAKLRRKGGRRTPESLSLWLDSTLDIFRERVLPFDARAARMAGELADRALASGSQPDVPDVYIAATAAVHGHIVLTRNLKHFLPLGVEAIDPLQTLPQ